jgi:hypothetical protein
MTYVKQRQTLTKICSLLTALALAQKLDMLHMQNGPVSAKSCKPVENSFKAALHK